MSVVVVAAIGRLYARRPMLANSIGGYLTFAGGDAVAQLGEREMRKNKNGLVG
jgi:hypothetical protein